MIIISAPPSDGGRNGPPGINQYLLAFSWIQSVTLSQSSFVHRSPGFETPCKMLWFVLVIRKTPGRGFGTYLGTRFQLFLWSVRWLQSRRSLTT